jgi:hypothetical protein
MEQAMESETIYIIGKSSVITTQFGNQASEIV